MVCNKYIEYDTYIIMKTNHHDVKIDKDDLYRCKDYKWRMCGKNGYVFAIINGQKTYLHSFIFNTDATVDHINHDIYDNRKNNLRISNKSQNMMNSVLSKRNTSGVKGVSFDTTRNKWMASIYKDGKNYNIGRKNILKQKSHTIHYGYIYDGEQMVDEVLVMIMKGPHSYTGEDTVEIDCHGGVFAMKKVLEAVIHAGARPAEPGEFTKRAFLNGRIDLIEAEGVMDLINSKTEKSRKLAINQVNGEVSKLIKDLRQKVIEILANIEVNIDYPEYEDIEDVKYDINIMFTDFRIDNNSVLSNSNILDKDINETECIYIPRGNNNISFAFCVPGYIYNKDIGTDGIKELFAGRTV